MDHHFPGPVRLGLAQYIAVMAEVFTPDIWIDLIIKVVDTTRNQNGPVGTFRDFHGEHSFKM
jgi:hypothetical protein